MRDLRNAFGPCYAADWLALAAAPTFAAMAVVTGILEGGAHQMPCAAGGMVPMYVLMSGFHFTPWVKLISRWRSCARPA